MTSRTEADEDPAFARQLLDAGRAEPLPTARTSAALATFAAGLTALHGAEPQALAVSQGAKAWSATKWPALSALVGSAITYVWLQSSGAPPAAPALTITAPVASSSDASAPLPAPPAASAPSELPAKRPALPRAPRRAAPDLAAEIAALDALRTALNIGAWKDAERQVAAYRRTFPRGALRNEAEVLAIRALVGQGRHEAAAGAARSFLASHPQDPQAASVRSLLEP